MKTQRILIFSILAFATGISLSAAAESAKPSLKVPDETRWRTSIETTCTESARRNNASSGVRNVDSGCACIARNVLKLAAFEESVQEAVEDLNWTKRYYSGAIGKREVQKDPLALFQFIYQFGTECAKNPGYEHDFGPGN